MTVRKPVLDRKTLLTGEGQYTFAGYASEVLSGKRAQPAGLVASIPTSQTGGFLLLDRAKVRVSRCGLRVREAAKAHEAALSDWPAAMFTMTYAPGNVPKPRDMINCVENLKKWAKRKLQVKALRYVWVAELQQGRARKGDSGAVHYHLVTWLPPELKRKGTAKARQNPRWKDSMVLPKLDTKGWWPHGMTERDWCRSSAVAYLAKYLSKGSAAHEGGATFQRGMRVQAAGGFAKPERFQRAFDHLPRWWREDMTPEHRGARAPGGGIVSRLTGELVRSPWIVVTTGRLVRLIQCSKTATQSERQQLKAQALASFFSMLTPASSAAVS